MHESRIMQIAKSAACQTFIASRRDNGTLIVVEKIELHDTAAKRLRMRSLRPFPVSSLCCSFSFGVLSNCPGTEFAGMELKSSKRRKIHSRVFPFSKKKNNLKLVISRCCFAEDGKEMYQYV